MSLEPGGLKATDDLDVCTADLFEESSQLCRGVLLSLGGMRSYHNGRISTSLSGDTYGPTREGVTENDQCNLNG